VRAYQTSKVKAGRGNLKQTPQAPASVTAAKTDEVTIVISWQDPADQVALVGYNIYRSYNGGIYQYLDTVAPVAYPASTSYTDETLPVGSYTYRVGCQAATIESTRTTSNTVQIVASAQDQWASNTPSGFSFTFGTPSRVSLSGYRPQSEPYLTMSSLAGFTLDDSTDELVYDGTGAVGQYTITVDSAASVFGWTIPDVPLALNPSEWSTGSSPVSGVGATYDLSQYANHAGTTPVYSITSGGGTGISVNESTGLLTVGPATTAATYSVTVELSSIPSEQDWLERSTADGVMWATDFRTSDNVTKWVVPQQEDYIADPATLNQIRRNASDSVIPGNGCLELQYVNGIKPRHHWSRLFGCQPGDLGYASGDVLLPSSWDTMSTRTRDFNHFRGGLYGHTSYHSDTPSPGIPFGGSTWQWEGSEFYIQFRVKLDPNRFSPLNAAVNKGFKLLYVELSGGSQQEYVILAPVPYNHHRHYKAYTNFGNPPELSPSLTDQQPGGDYSGACIYPNYGVGDGCWTWPLNEWVTILLHINPGRHGLSETWTRVWAATSAQSSYSLLWDVRTYPWVYGGTAEEGTYGATGPRAFNCFQPTMYLNVGDYPGVDFWTRFDQIIFSKQPIACPRAGA
jgi:hypothetical protein